MVENLLVRAAGVFERVGQDGKAVGVEGAGGRMRSS